MTGRRKKRTLKLAKTASKLNKPQTKPQSNESPRHSLPANVVFDVSITRSDFCRIVEIRWLKWVNFQNVMKAHWNLM
jgi:hypothetical protein